jgi:hypothetical protein
MNAESLLTSEVCCEERGSRILCGGGRVYRMKWKQAQPCNEHLLLYGKSEIGKMWKVDGILNKLWPADPQNNLQWILFQLQWL